MREPVTNQPMMAPVAAGGGLVAGISAALIAGFQFSDCLAYKTQRGECDQIASVAIPAMVAGAGSVIGVMGGLWTFNRHLRAPSPTSRKRDGNGRFAPED